MFKGIGCLLIFFFVIFVLLFKVLRNIYIALTGDDPTRRRRHNEPYRSGAESNATHTGNAERKRKIIPDDEGEYVDYEDIPDNK